MRKPRARERLMLQKLQITSGIWTFCGQKWAPRQAPLATLAPHFRWFAHGLRKPLALERLLVQNCKLPIASGSFVVRNGLQDGLLWPLWHLISACLRMVCASPVHLNGSWYKTANHHSHLDVLWSEMGSKTGSSGHFGSSS